MTSPLQLKLIRVLAHLGSCEAIARTEGLPELIEPIQRADALARELLGYVRAPAREPLP